MKNHLDEALSGYLIQLEEPIDSIAVFNLLVDLIKWCNKRRLNVDAELADAREYIAETGDANY